VLSFQADQPLLQPTPGPAVLGFGGVLVDLQDLCDFPVFIAFDRVKVEDHPVPRGHLLYDFKQLLAGEIRFVPCYLFQLCFPDVLNIIVIAVFSHPVIVGDRCVDHDSSHPGHQRTFTFEVVNVQEDFNKSFLHYILRLFHIPGITIANTQQDAGVFLEEFPLSGVFALHAALKYVSVTVHPLVQELDMRLFAMVAQWFNKIMHFFLVWWGKLLRLAV